jgi:hypothetical protein
MKFMFCILMNIMHLACASETAVGNDVHVMAAAR